MVERVVSDEIEVHNTKESPLEVARRIHNYFSYWHKWELVKIEIDQPEIYEETLSEYNRLVREIDNKRQTD